MKRVSQIDSSSRGLPFVHSLYFVRATENSHSADSFDCPGLDSGRGERAGSRNDVLELATSNPANRRSAPVILC